MHQTTNQYESQWLNGEISSEEFLQNANSGDSKSILLKSLSRTECFDVPNKSTQQEAWANLEKKFSEEQSQKATPLYRSYWIGIAASLILAIGAFFIFKQSSISTNHSIIATSLAEVQTVYLPDSSVVYLNAGSKVSFSESEWKNERMLSLIGEAFFEVKKGSDFTVETQLGDVIVMGTSFNVKERNNVLEVACKTGKVKVIVKNSGESQVITPGQVLVTEDGEIKDVSSISLVYIDNWRTGDFDFESVMLTQVFEELERQYDVNLEFDINDIQDRTYTGYFNNKNLTEALQLVCSPMGLHFQIEDKQVKIMSKSVLTP
ncbi:FecR family protein [Roseivirga sp.]|uniref:FecR family protein n=1 Tax=Roseivirga sp. TaxID=1964215 RepID=UPI002B274633|nr:FecR domain-containing protein [Roseivirga sp.]